MTHRRALTITLLIIAGKQQPAARESDSPIEYAAYDVLAHAMDLSGYSEERRADLYARIVEAVPGEDVRVADLEKIVSRALEQNDKEFHNG
jgi:hypothetical protein